MALRLCLRFNVLKSRCNQLTTHSCKINPTSSIHVRMYSEELNKSNKKLNEDNTDAHQLPIQTSRLTGSDKKWILRGKFDEYKTLEDIPDEMPSKKLGALLQKARLFWSTKAIAVFLFTFMVLDHIARKVIIKWKTGKNMEEQSHFVQPNKK